MRISSFAVRNPQFTLVAFLCVAALGAFAFIHIPRSEDPYFPTPTFQIVAVYPGASPEDIEREVVDKIEERLVELSNINHLRTQIEDNLAFIRVDFVPGIDTAKKEDEVRRQVAAARPDLPAGVKSVEVTHYETTNVAILQLALLTPRGAPAGQTKATGDRLIRRLESIRGVKSVDGWAYPEEVARVELDIGRLARHGVGVGQIVQTLGGANTNIPGGEVTLGKRRFDVKTSGAYDGIDQVRATALTPGSGQVVTIGDVSDVVLRPVDDAYIGRYDGKHAGFITVAMREGENIFHVRDAVLAEVTAFERELPAGMKLEVGFDQSNNVSHRLGGLERDFAIAIVLILITLIPLGVRASLVVMISIPTSLAIGVALLYALGYSLNQLSIVGFVVALGLLVDDSIVVAENIARHLREGKSRNEAAILATKQIGIAVVGCTATLIFAFLPLLFLPGNAGLFIRSLPVAVVVTIGASLVVSLTLIPFLASRVMKGHTGQHSHGNWAFRATNAGIEKAYRPVLVAAMRHPLITLALTAALVAGAVSLAPRIGFSLFPTAGIPQVLVTIETPDGTSLAGTDDVARQAEAIVRGEPSVRHILTSVGHGNPQIYYNVAPRQTSTSVADLFLQLDRYDAHATPALLDRLRHALSAIPNAEIRIREFENGPPIEAPIAIRVFGDDLEELRRQAEAVSGVLSRIPGARDVHNPLAIQRTDVSVELDPQRSALAGVTELDIDRAVRLAVSGLTIGKLHQGIGDDIDLVVGLPRPARPDLSILDRLEIPTAAAGYVPFAQVARLELRSSSRAIQHDGRQRVVTVTANVATGANARRVTNAAVERIAQLPLPAGYRWEAGGLVESQKESFSGLGPAILIAVFGVLAILILEFRSFSATLIVASVIPLGAAGGLVALFLAGETLSFTTLIGFIALTGIEVKNSILLVDFTNQLRAEGVPLAEAIRRAGETRFFPILLTSMTAIGGLIPLVVEHSNLYSPLALVLIGGLVSSTAMSRLVTPVMSKLLLPKDQLDDAPIAIATEV
ncbi:MAG: acriflavin resistance protein [Myxococcales bacterium]|nr:acriflavin resistance protein [Myxococcales bacterium]